MDSITRSSRHLAVLVARNLSVVDRAYVRFAALIRVGGRAGHPRKRILSLRGDRHLGGGLC